MISLLNVVHGTVHDSQTFQLLLLLFHGPFSGVEVGLFLRKMYSNICFESKIQEVSQC